MRISAGRGGVHSKHKTMAYTVKQVAAMSGVNTGWPHHVNHDQDEWIYVGDRQEAVRRNCIPSMQPTTTQLSLKIPMAFALRSRTFGKSDGAVSCTSRGTREKSEVEVQVKVAAQDIFYR